MWHTLDARICGLRVENLKPHAMNVLVWSGDFEDQREEQILALLLSGDRLGSDETVSFSREDREEISQPLKERHAKRGASSSNLQPGHPLLDGTPRSKCLSAKKISSTASEPAPTDRVCRKQKKHNYGKIHEKDLQRTGACSLTRDPHLLWLLSERCGRSDAWTGPAGSMKVALPVFRGEIKNKIKQRGRTNKSANMWGRNTSRWRQAAQHQAWPGDRRMKQRWGRRKHDRGTIDTRNGVKL